MNACQFQLGEKIVCGREIGDLAVHVQCGRNRCINACVIIYGVPCHAFVAPSAGVRAMDGVRDALFAPGTPIVETSAGLREVAVIADEVQSILCEMAHDSMESLGTKQDYQILRAAAHVLRVLRSVAKPEESTRREVKALNAAIDFLGIVAEELEQSEETGEVQ